MATFTPNQLRWWTAAMLLIAIGLATYMTVYVWQRVDKPQTRDDGLVVPHRTEDYAYFYAAGNAMRNGQDIYTAIAPGRDRAGYIYPPLIAFLYQPLTRLGFIPGARAALLCNVAAMIAALAFAARAVLERLSKIHTWPAVLTVAVFAAILSVDKIRGELQMLQTNVWVALAMALGLWLLDRRPTWAGAAIGFAINVKYQALALLFYLIFRRRWKAAGATIAWTLVWGFLPAISVGFQQDANYLMRGFSGLLKMVGFTMAADVANVEPIYSPLSVSITSGAARILRQWNASVSPFLLAGVIALLWLLILAILYRSQKLPTLKWPAAKDQSTPPWSRMVAVEWMTMIAAVLAFSPQTNTRHLVLTALLMVLGITLACEAKGKFRWAALAGIATLWAGMNLPPGSRTAAEQAGAVAFWHSIGGPTWSLLVTMALLTYSGLSIAKTNPAPAKISEIPTHISEPPTNAPQTG